MDTLNLPRSLVQVIYAHAQQNAEQQQGGVIIGHDPQSMRFQALTNSSEAPATDYVPNPTQLSQLDAEKISAVVYSQPVGEGKPQVLTAFQQHWVVSLNTKGVLELYIWDTSNQPATAVPQKLAIS